MSVTVPWGRRPWDFAAPSHLLPPSHYLITAKMPGLTVEEKRQRRAEPVIAAAAPPKHQHQKKRTWDERFEALAAYRNSHGDCNVPLRYKDDRPLGQFVSKIRREGRAALTDDRRERLDKLGFDWETNDERLEREWDENFAKLKKYRSRFGHCRVPQNWKEDPKLASWVNSQRGKQKEGQATFASRGQASID